MEDTNHLVYVFEYNADIGRKWFGFTCYGRPVYICYKWGKLSVRVGEKDSDWLTAVVGREILCFYQHGRFTRNISYSELRMILKAYTIETPEKVSEFSEKLGGTIAFYLATEDLMSIIQKTEELAYIGEN